MTAFIQVLTTTASKEDALAIADDLLSRKLAACVQVFGPLISRYWWQGCQEESTEWQCSIKTHRDIYEQVEARIRAMHPYTTPEIIALAIEGGSEPYLAWLAGELSLPRKG